MSGNKKFPITVAITTFDRPDDLKECLLSLSKQSSKDFDVLVVNGGEKEPVEALVKDFGLAIRVVGQEKKGLVEARNLCWRQAHSDIVCMIDDDLVVSEGWLKEVLAAFQSDEKIAGVTGPTLVHSDRRDDRDAFSIISKFEEGNLLWKTAGMFYLNFIMEGKAREIGRILDCGTFTLGSNYPECLKIKGLIDVDYLEACHMCLKRGLVEKAGGFDDSYTGTSEWSEPDLAFKIRKMGYRLVFNPAAVTEHRISQQGVFKARTYAYERSVNFINFYFKNIKPNTFRKFTRFYAYLMFMNAYWVYKALISRNFNWLTGITGAVAALCKNIFKHPKDKK